MWNSLWTKWLSDQTCQFQPRHICLICAAPFIWVMYGNFFAAVLIYFNFSHCFLLFLFSSASGSLARSQWDFQQLSTESAAGWWCTLRQAVTPSSQDGHLATITTTFMITIPPATFVSEVALLLWFWCGCCVLTEGCVIYSVKCVSHAETREVITLGMKLNNNGDREPFWWLFRADWQKRSSPAELYDAFRAGEAPVANSFWAGRAVWFSIHQPMTCVTGRAVNPITFMAMVHAPAPPAPTPPLVSFLINLCCNELPPGLVLSSAPSEVGTRLESRLRGRKRAEMMQQKVGRDVPAAQDRL